MNTDKLKQIGNEWEKGENHRIYITEDGKAQLWGLRLQYYRSGNIEKAWLDGEEISNSAAKALCDKLHDVNVWYDYTDDKIHAKHPVSIPKTARKLIDLVTEYSA